MTIRKKEIGKKIEFNGNRDLKEIFKKIERVRSDLIRCGKLLNDISPFMDFPFFENSNCYFKVTYGLRSETIHADLLKDSNTVILENPWHSFFKKGRRVVIYTLEKKIFQLNRIKSVDKNRLIVEEKLIADFPGSSVIIVMGGVEYKYYPGQKALKRKVNNGGFLLFYKEVTDFFVKYFPESCSVLYRIELNRKEQIRGYVFLPSIKHEKEEKKKKLDDKTRQSMNDEQHFIMC